MACVTGFPYGTISAISPARSRGTVVCQDQILQLNLHVDPLIIRQAGPDVVRLRHLEVMEWRSEKGWRSWLVMVNGKFWNL